MDICLRVLKESNKSRFDSYSVRNSILIISHITFRDCRGHIFFDNLSRNSCILVCAVCPSNPKPGSTLRFETLNTEPSYLWTWNNLIRVSCFPSIYDPGQYIICKLTIENSCSIIYVNGIHVMNKIKRVRWAYVYRTLDIDVPWFGNTDIKYYFYLKGGFVVLTTSTFSHL